MGFRFVHKSMTLNDLERGKNIHVCAIIGNQEVFAIGASFGYVSCAAPHALTDL